MGSDQKPSMSDKRYKTREELLCGEWIGLRANISGTGISGRIIDESKNMLWIETEKGTKKVSKKNNRFVFDAFPDAAVNGRDVCMRPEERIKMKTKAK